MKPHNTYPFLKFYPNFCPKGVLAEVYQEVLPKPVEISMLKSDWLAQYHPIPNAKFPASTALINRSTYHKSAKGSPPPCSQILWAPQINE